MNSSVSSTSQPSWTTDPPRLVVPARDQLVDMLRFYATSEVRALLMSAHETDREALEDRLVAELRSQIESWVPQHEWYWDKVHLKGRTVEWLAWCVAVSADPEWASVFRDEPILPFAIDVDTLPRWESLPTMVVSPERLGDASAPASTQQ